MKRTILPALLILTTILLSSSMTFALDTGGAMSGIRAVEGFSVREYEEFHHVLHPLEHEALPQGDFKRIRAEAGELVRLGEAILKLGVPAGVAEQHAKEFTEELTRFREALAKFKKDAEAGTDAQLKASYSAVHDSFEMLAALLPPVKRGS